MKLLAKKIATICGMILITSIANVMLSSCADPYFNDFGENTTIAENAAYDNVNFNKKLINLLESKYPQAKVLITTNHFNVLLTGEVDSAQTKAGIENLLKTHNEIKHLWNFIVVSREPKLRRNSSIASDAKERLHREPELNIDDINVVAVAGVVYIMGDNVGDSKRLAEAIQGIYAIEGVNKVINLTQVNADNYSIFNKD